MAEPHIYRQKFAVLLSDVIAFLGAFAFAMHLRFNVDIGVFEHGLPPWAPMLNTLPIMLGIWLVTLRSCGLYRLERLGALAEVGGLTKSLILFMGVLLSVSFFYRGFSYSRGFVLLFVPLLVALTFLPRAAFRVIRRRVMSLAGVRQRVLLIGHSPVTAHLAKTASSAESPIKVVGILDDETQIGTLVEGAPVLGGLATLREAAAKTSAHGVIVASKLDDKTQLDLLDQCLALKLEWQAVPTVYEIMLDRVSVDVVGGVPLLALRRSNIRGLNRLLKRAFDVVVSALMLVVLSPLMLAVSGLIKLASKGPVFFKQQRVGENGRVFEFIKFRSMHVNNDDGIHREYAKKWIAEGQAADKDRGDAVYKIKNDPRIIPYVGPFIRKYSVDELPQLLNVLRGDMSLIGPRPPIPYEVDVYREWHRRRLDGPQGITGLWQVSGRNRLSFDEMVKLDIEYIENWSFGLDLRILWRTIGVVLFDRAY